MCTLRPARAEDAAQVAEVHRLGWEAYRGVIDDRVLDAVDPAATLARWKSQLARNGATTTTWVAEDAGSVVGFVVWGPCLDPGEAESCELWDLWVRPERRSQGIGARLVETALAHTGRPLVLWVLSTNTRGRAFYQRLGARADGLQRQRPMDAGDEQVWLTDVRLRFAD